VSYRKSRNARPVPEPNPVDDGREWAIELPEPEGKKQDSTIPNRMETGILLFVRRASAHLEKGRPSSRVIAASPSRLSQDEPLDWYDR
jgi:hypothetical protein